MTMEQMLMCPKGVNFASWQDHLCKMASLATKIMRISDRIQDLSDALDVLSDETESVRYKDRMYQLSIQRGKLDKAKLEFEKEKNKYV